ncbi:MAG: hypothetical protein GF384_03845 [Elusimicrobia bacterium]|nr:hypothetical protein [Elusimicrobiota bacterium]MBD3412035.1 hypothetical protein [Elusimicrobiota bacterium]
MKRLIIRIASLYKHFVVYIEGRIFLYGLALCFAYLCCLGLVSIFKPDLIHILVSMTATNIIFSRAAGMSLGYTMGVDTWIIVTVAIITETMLVLLIYPLFVLSWKHLIVINRLKRSMDKITHIANNKQPVINRYGWIGLCIFVFLPFWMTGPVVGAVIGFFIGLQPVTTVVIVLLSTHISTLGWALLLDNLYDYITVYSPYAPIVFFVCILVLVLIGKFSYNRKYSDNTTKKE